MKLTNLVFLLLATVPVIASFGQSFPKNFHYDEDAHRLSIELHDEEGFYNIDEIAEINLEFYNSNYWNLLHSYYDTDTYLPAKLYYNGELFDSVGVQFKGQTSYRLAKQQGSTKLRTRKF